MTQPNADKAVFAGGESLADQILEVIVSEGKIDRARATPDATLESLEIQSIDIVMILMVIEEKFGVYVPIDGSIAEAKDLNGFMQQIESRILAERA
ncbi:acyl carrier protein [Bradyrhizobium sp. WD16]|uniref:acyl carrier protein n=1 Tax=Bradyrhizobium sp. WD16 TaxID=1521768 RepID=UPI0020A2DDCD|nr:phosphopantetheine-binding protein [Bradyrhizobium sp. WD16]